MTTTALRQLDSQKKYLVIQFLYDSGILKRRENIFNSDYVSNAERHLKGVTFDQINFSPEEDYSSISLRNIQTIET